MGIIYGLAAAILWGSGDVLINRLTVLVGTSKSLVWTQVLSLAFWLIYGLSAGVPKSGGIRPWEIAAFCGVFHVAGMFFTYRAFEVGTLSIVSPIASSFAIVTAALALCAGERPGGYALGGAGLLILGVIVVTRSASGGGNATRKGIPEALASAVGFGVMFWLIDRTYPALGMAWPLVVLKVMASLSAVVAVSLARKKNPAEEVPAEAPKFRGEVWILAAGVMLTDSFAWVTFMLGQGHSYTTIVTALASLFSVVTVILAAVLLRERLNRPQWAGIIAIFVGILLVSLKFQ